jgi:hypothetical protein
VEIKHPISPPEGKGEAFMNPVNAPTNTFIFWCQSCGEIMDGNGNKVGLNICYPTKPHTKDLHPSICA